MICRRVFLLCNALLFTTVVNAQSIETPEKLKADVRFWELVFGKYKSNECVFHDSRYLNVIYGVKRIPHQRARQERIIAQYRKKIAKSIASIAAGDAGESKMTRTILAAVPEHMQTRQFWKSAPANIRCQIGVADSFKLGLARSKKYLPFIKKQLQRQGLPTDLAYLPHLESGYNYKAHSKVGARGLWQLMPSVAREAGMKVSWYKDDRLDVHKSTNVALRILRRNFGMVESWPLAMTGYNYGINGIKRGIRKTGTSDYMKFRRVHRSPSFGFAAKNFFPSFLAVRNLAKSYESGGYEDTVAIR